MSYHAHGCEDHQKVQEDCKVSDKAVVFESADLGHEEPGDDEQQRTDNIAEAESGDLTYILTVLDCHMAEDKE